MKKQAHTKLVNEIILSLQKHFEGRFFKRDVGKFRIGDRWISFGTPGMADIYGWVKVGDHCLHFECEVKIFPDKLSRGQNAFKNLCKEHGVLYVLATGPNQAVKKLTEKINEQRKSY